MAPSRRSSRSDDLSLDNYRTTLDTVPALRFLLNSIVVSGVTVALGLFINSLAAFGLSRLQWKGRKIVLALVLATLVVPFETFALPLLWWVNHLPWLTHDGFTLLWTEGWLDTYRVQILPFVANAFSIYLFYSYFQSIPKELDEAAIVDGAGWFRSTAASSCRSPARYRLGLDPDVPPRLELLPVAPHGGADRGIAARHARCQLLLPAQRRVGPDDGLLSA